MQRSFSPIKAGTHSISGKCDIPYSHFSIGKFCSLFDAVSVLHNGKVVICRHLYDEHDFEYTSIELLDIDNKSLDLLTTVTGFTNKTSLRSDNSIVIGQSNGDIHLVEWNANQGSVNDNEHSDSDIKKFSIQKIHSNPGQEIVGLVALPDNRTIIVMYENAEVERLDLFENTRLTKKFTSLDPSKFYGNKLAILNSDEGCYFVKNSAGLIELYDAFNLEHNIQYSVMGMNDKNDFKVDLIHALPDGKHFICTFTSKQGAGNNKIAIASIYASTLNIIRDISYNYCQLIILSNGIIIGTNGFYNSYSIYDIAHGYEVSSLPKPDRAHHMYALPNGRFLAISEKGDAIVYDCSSLTPHKDLGAAFNQWIPVKPQLIPCEKLRAFDTSTSRIAAILRENSPAAIPMTESECQLLNQAIAESHTLALVPDEQDFVEEICELNTDPASTADEELTISLNETRSSSFSDTDYDSSDSVKCCQQ